MIGLLIYFEAEFGVWCLLVWRKHPQQGQQVIKNESCLVLAAVFFVKL